MKSAEEIAAIYKQRQKERGPLLARWQEATTMADGDVTIPLAELDDNSRATVVNLFPTGLSALSSRAGSVAADQEWPAVRDGFQGSEDRSYNRRKAGLSWWDGNNMDILNRKWFTYHFGFGCAAVSLSPVSTSTLDRREIPHWRVRNPMMTFPAPCEDELGMEPVDAIFACRRSRAWLKATYPAQYNMLNTGDPSRFRPDDMFDVLEYTDCDEFVLVACGNANAGGQNIWTPPTYSRGVPSVVLEQCINKAGIPLVVQAGRVTLGRLQGALDQMIPAYYRAARLNALNELAIARGIFPEQWVVAHPNDPQAPEIIVEANALTGQIGEIAHGTIMTLGNPPAAAQQAQMAISDLERSQRVVGNLPAEVNGESASNIRTARRGEQVLGSAIDMPIQEAQEIRAAAAEAELRRAAAIACGYWGNSKTFFFSSYDGKKQREIPDTFKETFETDEVYVKYAMAGADANSMVVAILQRVQGGLMSEQTGREMDPAVEDPILERDMIELEGIRRALLQSLEQAAQQGQLGPDQIALIAKIKWATHDQLEDVVLAAHKQMQAQQAAQQQLPPGSPGTQPGVGPGQPASGGPPNPFGGAPSSPALAQILGTLSQPAQQGQAEAAQVQPPQSPVAA